MRKEALAAAYGTLIALPFIFGGCHSQEKLKNTSATKTGVSTENPDFSQYVPMIVSIDPSPEDCKESGNTIDYHSGENMQLYSPVTNSLLTFEVSVDGKDAVFQRKGSIYAGGVQEGEVFGILTDTQGRGAYTIGRIVEVGSDSVKIVRLDCPTY